MANLIGLREYARHRGCGLSSVQYAIKAGRIQAVIVDGKQKIDVEQADVEWEQNTDASKRRGKFTQKLHESVESNEPPQEQSKEKPRSTFSDAKTATQIAQAELLRLELREKQGKLISSDEVKAEAFRLGRQVRDNMLNIPSRVISKIRAAKTEHEAYEVLEFEIRQACEGLKGE